MISDLFSSIHPEPFEVFVVLSGICIKALIAISIGAAVVVVIARVV